MKLRPAGRQAKSELERRLGRKIRFKPEDEDLLERLEVRARQIDPEAYAAYDRQGLATPVRLQDRCAYALVLAGEEYLCYGRPDLVTVLRTLNKNTLH